MRRPAEPSSALFQPLDFILGTTGAVRILRVMSEYGDVISASRIAERARLGRAGVGRTIADLVELGIVDAVGGASGKVYRLGTGHPLVPAITALFREEAARVDDLTTQIASLAQNLKPGPEAVWLFGSVATRSDRPSSDIDIAIVDNGNGRSRSMDDPLTNQIIELAGKSGLHASIINLNRDDIHRLRASRDPFWSTVEREAVPLFGPSPSTMASDGNQEGE